MKALILLVAVLWCCQPLLGQNLVVNKTWNYNNITDSFLQILKWKDSTKYCTITTRKYRLQIPNYASGTCIAKINNLDTVWVRNLFSYGTPRGLVRYGDKLVVLMATAYSTISNSNTESIEILEVDTNGTVLRRLPFVHPRFRYGPEGILISSDSCYVVYGDVTGSPTKPGYQCDWCLIKYNPRTNRTEFEKYYNPGSSYSCGCYVENAPGGGFLVSGTNGAKVSYVHTNVMGDTLEPIKSIGPIFLNWPALGAKVKLHPTGGYVYSATASNFAGLAKGVIGLLDPQGNQLWEKSFTGGGLTGLAFKVNQDGTIFDHLARNSVFYYRKIASDSTTIWERPFTQSSPTDRFVLYDASYESDSSVTFVGYAKTSSPNAQKFYMARITGIGQPFNPVTNVTLPRETEAVSLYPNPTSGQVQLNRSGVLQLYDGLGRVMGTWQVEAGQALDLGGLAKGIYYWRLNGYAGHRVVVE